MSSSNKNIENLFSDKFNKFELSPPPNTWGKLETKLRWKEFFKFTLTSFNFYYALTLAIVISSSVLFLFSDSKTSIKKSIPQDFSVFEKIKDEQKNDIVIDNSATIENVESIEKTDTEASKIKKTTQTIVEKEPVKTKTKNNTSKIKQESIVTIETYSDTTIEVITTKQKVKKGTKPDTTTKTIIKKEKAPIIIKTESGQEIIIEDN